MSDKDADKRKPKILVVDDDRFFLRQMVDILLQGGFRPEGVLNGFDAREALLKNRFDVVVTDVVMKDMSGIDLLKDVRRRDHLCQQRAFF